MYNEAQKMEFLNSGIVAPGSMNLAANLFKSCEKFELAWGADVCTRTREEVQPMINVIFGMKVQSISSRFNILQRYIKWCLDNHIPGARDDLLHIQPDLVSIVGQRTVPNPVALQRILDLTFHPERMQTSDNVSRAYFWLAFSGVMQAESYLITTNEIDLARAVITHKGREYRIYREAIPSFLNCMNLTEFNIFGRNGTVKRVPGDNLLRTSSKRDARDKFPHSVLWHSSMKLKDTYEYGSIDTKLSYERVWSSGVFYRQFELENAGFKVDFRDVVKFQMSSTEYSEKMMEPDNQAAIKSKLLRAYREDYDNWKRAFYNK